MKVSWNINNESTYLQCKEKYYYDGCTGKKVERIGALFSQVCSFLSVVIDFLVVQIFKDIVSSYGLV